MAAAGGKLAVNATVRSRAQPAVKASGLTTAFGGLWLALARDDGLLATTQKSGEFTDVSNFATDLEVVGHGLGLFEARMMESGLDVETVALLLPLPLPTRPRPQPRLVGGKKWPDRDNFGIAFFMFQSGLICRLWQLLFHSPAFFAFH